MAPFTMRVPLDRVTGLAIDPGATFALDGLMTSTLDGASFDGARLFDLPAGGLRILSPASRSGAYVLRWTGDTAPACAAAGVPSPCLIPRLPQLAHERLRTSQELAGTLTGSIDLVSPAAPTDPEEVMDARLGAVAVFVLVAAVLSGAVWVGLRLLRRRAEDAVKRVRAASRRALRAIHGDPTLLPLGPKIGALVVRARQLDAVRRACAAKLRRVDREALDRKAAVLALASGPSVEAAKATLAIEREEAARLDREVTSATVELDRIESALRVVTLRAGTRDARTGADPVDALVAELDLREQALLEAGAP
ncbi:MAG TPA: hypothetical protein VHV30_07015 [Polyangiaceae bacterium]|jgi:hypothetical protein|nr:hypothetical protein [Polyangiaceae bacterium]